MSLQLVPFNISSPIIHKGSHIAISQCIPPCQKACHWFFIDLSHYECLLWALHIHFVQCQQDIIWDFVTNFKSWQEVKPQKVLCKSSSYKWAYPNLVNNIGGIVIFLSVFICFIVGPAVKPISKLIKLHAPNFKLVDNSTSIEGGKSTLKTRTSQLILH